jgi:hypothetical protein
MVWISPFMVDAGWSSPVARQAHNLKVAGSNPAPATRKSKKNKALGFYLTPFSLPNTQTRCEHGFDHFARLW